MVKWLVLAAILCGGSAGAAPARSPVGTWFTEDRGGVVQISACGADLCGFIVGLTPDPDGKLPRDFQGGPQCRRMLLKNLQFQDDGRWHGTVTNPQDGRTYDAEVWVGDDGNMRLRGYIGVPLLGSTQVWPPFDRHVLADCRIR